VSVVFLVATYNESAEIVDLLDKVAEHIEEIVVSDDGSTDDTTDKIEAWSAVNKERKVDIIYNDHTGLPETVKKKGVEFIHYIYGPDQWVLMLDADERVDEATLKDIVDFTNSDLSIGITHIWFVLDEYIDGRGPLRSFLKCRLFRAGSAAFSEAVHEDDRFDGQGANFSWRVIHRKSSEKQIMREKEYLETYKRLLEEGKVTQEWVNRCIGFHYFVKE
jgi:glycosyltransferase involved in cell wall biosynthesis